MRMKKTKFFTNQRNRWKFTWLLSIEQQKDTTENFWVFGDGNIFVKVIWSNSEDCHGYVSYWENDHGMEKPE